MLLERFVHPSASTKKANHAVEGLWVRFYGLVWGFACRMYMETVQYAGMVYSLQAGTGRIPRIETPNRKQQTKTNTFGRSLSAIRLKPSHLHLAVPKILTQATMSFVEQWHTTQIQHSSVIATSSFVKPHRLVHILDSARLEPLNGRPREGEMSRDGLVYLRICSHKFSMWTTTASAIQSRSPIYPQPDFLPRRPLRSAHGHYPTILVSRPIP